MVTDPPCPKSSSFNVHQFAKKETPNVSTTCEPIIQFKNNILNSFCTLGWNVMSKCQLPSTNNVWMRGFQRLRWEIISERVDHLETRLFLEPARPYSTKCIYWPFSSPREKELGTNYSWADASQETNLTIPLNCKKKITKN